MQSPSATALVAAGGATEGGFVHRTSVQNVMDDEVLSQPLVTTSLTQRMQKANFLGHVAGSLSKDTFATVFPDCAQAHWVFSWSLPKLGKACTRLL